MLITEIRRAIEKYNLVSPGDHVLVAVSGGADSIALLYALNELKSGLKIRLTAAHLNHLIRGKDADNDAAYVRKTAERLGIAYMERRTDVPRLSRKKGISLEMAAREARYDFFAKAAREIKANAVATAHTADDQAETILLKLVRGAGPRGLSGISRETVINGVKIIRPMLDTGRKEVIAYLKEEKAEWREDKSNKDVSFLRNRIRHEILPLLEKKFNPRIKETLCRTAEILREENAVLDELARKELKRCSKTSSNSGSSCIICCSSLLKVPLALRRRALFLWLVESGVPAELLDFDAIEKIQALMRKAKGSGGIDIVGNWTVKKQYERLMLEPRVKRKKVTAFRRELKIPGELVLTEQNLRVVTSLEKRLEKPKSACPGIYPARASLDYSSLGRGKIIVRAWRKGDRMRPYGMKGTKKLQDIFVDAKVPVEERSCVPVFECRGEIIWVAGYRIAGGWKVKDMKKPSLQILVERAYESRQLHFI